LLVAASPRDEIADTHWYRADFDHFLVKGSAKVGRRCTSISVDLRGKSQEEADGPDPAKAVRERSVKFSSGAKFVIDATGPRGFLHRALQQLRRERLPGFPSDTVALFSHFSGELRLVLKGSDSTEQRAPRRPIPSMTRLFIISSMADGSGCLQFNNGITSAGVAATDSCASRLRFPEGQAAWEWLLDQIPALKEQFAGATAERPFTHMPRLGFRSARIAGNRWALLPSAAGFVDPLLSTGFPLTLLGLARLARILEEDWEKPDNLPRACRDTPSRPTGNCSQRPG
jgi:FADH2 O2-dependent halogenase